MNELTETEWAYLAGFIDGDGCITINVGGTKGSVTPSHRLLLLITQANKEYLEKWCARVGLGRVYAIHSGESPIQGTKQCYNWQMSGRQAEAVLRKVLPYLDIKREQAEIAIKFRTTAGRQGGIGGRRVNPSGIIRLRERYAQQLRALKREGDPLSLEPEQATLEAQYQAQMGLWE